MASQTNWEWEIVGVQIVGVQQRARTRAGVHRRTFVAFYKSRKHGGSAKAGGVQHGGRHRHRPDNHHKVHERNNSKRPYMETETVHVMKAEGKMVMREMVVFVGTWRRRT